MMCTLDWSIYWMVYTIDSIMNGSTLNGSTLNGSTLNGSTLNDVNTLDWSIY